MGLEREKFGKTFSQHRVIFRNMKSQKRSESKIGVTCSINSNFSKCIPE